MEMPVSDRADGQHMAEMIQNYVYAAFGRSLVSWEMPEPAHVLPRYAPYDDGDDGES